MAGNRIISLSTADSQGGAAIAAHRIHEAVRSVGVDAKMMVDFKRTDDPNVVQFGNINLARVKYAFDLPRKYLLHTENTTQHSLSLLPTRKSRMLALSGYQLAHLHSVAVDFMSIEDIGRLSIPALWTIHDMWPIAGAEHYAIDDRWRTGYLDKRSSYETGVDVNRWVFNRKLKAWKRPIAIVSPSKWLASLAKQSPLTSTWPIHVIPNAINTEKWIPIDKQVARAILGIPDSLVLIGFGAIGGVADPRKGADLLGKILSDLRRSIPNIAALVFGGGSDITVDGAPFPSHRLGKLSDEVSLRVAYAAMDLFVIPSRQDNLPNTGLEALASGRPVFGFEVGGVPEIAVEGVVGHVAPIDQPGLLASKIVNCLKTDGLLDQYSNAARSYALKNYSYGVVGTKYSELYNELGLLLN